MSLSDDWRDGYERFAADLSPVYPYLPYLALTVLLPVGFYLRVLGVGVPPLMNDEAIMGLVATSVAETGKPLLPAGYGYYVGPLVSYLQGLSTLLFGKSVFALRFPGVVVGTATIAVVYAFGTKVADQRVGVFAATLYTFSVINVAWARTARFYVYLQFFVLLGVYAYLRGREHVRFDYDRRWFEVSSRRAVAVYAGVYAVTVVCAYLTHSAWPLLLGVFGLHVAVPNRDDPDAVRRFKLAGWTLLAVVAVYVAVTRSVPVPAALLREVGLSSLADLDLWHHPISGKSPVWFFLTYYPVVSAVAAVGTLAALRNREDASIVLVAFYAPLYLFTVFGGQFRFIWRPRYLLVTMPFLFVLAGLGVLTAARLLRRSLDGDLPGLEAAAIAGVALLLLTTPVAQDVRFADDPYESSHIEEPQPSYLGACQVMNGTVHEDDTVITNRPNQLYFWLESVDYRGNNWTSQWTPNPGRGYYLGTPMIDTAAEMKEIVRNNDRVWVVYNPFMPLRAQSWIEENLNLYGVVRSPFDTRFPYRIYDSGRRAERQERVYVYTKGITENESSGEEVETAC